MIAPVFMFASLLDILCCVEFSIIITKISCVPSTLPSLRSYLGPYLRIHPSLCILDVKPLPSPPDDRPTDSSICPSQRRADAKKPRITWLRNIFRAKTFNESTVPTCSYTSSITPTRSYYKMPPPLLQAAYRLRSTCRPILAQHSGRGHDELLNLVNARGSDAATSTPTPPLIAPSASTKTAPLAAADPRLHPSVSLRVPCSIPAGMRAPRYVDDLAQNDSVADEEMGGSAAHLKQRSSWWVGV